jgi:hypothetical protein
LRPIRIYLQVVTLALVVIGSLGAATEDLITRTRLWIPANLHDDPVTNWERRIEPLKDELPPTGAIGYLSDWDLPDWEGSRSDMDNEYRLTQYALAPRLVLRGSGYTQIVANLSDPRDVARIEALFQVKKVREFGFGIYLFAWQRP